MPFTKDEIKAMTISEKQELLDIFWEVIEKESYVDNIEKESEEEIQLLQERLKEYKSNPSASIKWNNLKEELSNPHDD